jgi:hypothetical protein
MVALISALVVTAIGFGGFELLRATGVSIVLNRGTVVLLGLVFLVLLVAVLVFADRVVRRVRARFGRGSRTSD